MIKYPDSLKIELTNYCDGNCVFCSNSLNKPKGYMDIEMFKKIIDDFPEVKKISPQWFGESSLHPNFYEALKYAKDKGKIMHFYTNGHSIDPDKLSEIGIDHVLFSIEADNKELYENMRRGLKWDAVYGNIMRFYELKGKTKVSVRMTVTKENRDRIKEIEMFWEKRVKNVTLFNEHSVCREVEGHYKKIKSCKKPYEVMMIGWNGDYIMCCTDYNRKITLGNAKDGARKAWDAGAKIREQVAKGKMLDICKECGFTHTAYLTKV